MSRNRLGTRRTLRFGGGGTSAPSNLYLPAVDIYSDQTPPLISGLPDITYDCMGSLLTSSRTSPILGNHVSFAAGFQYQPIDFTSWSVWIWCNILTIEGNIDASGSIGEAAFIDFCSCIPTGYGGTGGSGGSGGGGGAISNVVGANGGNGGSGNDGSPGNADTIGCCANYPGNGGGGTGLTYMAGSPYSPPSGGNGGGAGGCAGGGGSGGSGYGGGGAGGAANGGFPSLVAGGGAGGGAGGLFIVCNELYGTGLLSADGGSGGLGAGSGGMQGFPGGGGSIYAAAKKYGATLSLSVQAPIFCGCGSPADNGNYRFGEINHAGTAVTVYHNNVNTSWDNT